MRGYIALFCFYCFCVDAESTKSKSAPIDCLKVKAETKSNSYSMSLKPPKPPTPSSSAENSPLSDLEISLNLENAYERASNVTVSNKGSGGLPLAPISSVQEVDDYGDEEVYDFVIEKPVSINIEEIYSNTNSLRSTTHTQMAMMQNTQSNVSNISAAYSAALSPTATTRSSRISQSASNNTVIVHKEGEEEIIPKEQDENKFIYIEDSPNSMPEPKTFDGDELPKALSIDMGMEIMQTKPSIESSHTNTPPTPESPDSRSMDSNSNHFDRLLKSIDESIANHHGGVTADATLSNATVTSSGSHRNEKHIAEDEGIETTPEPLKNTSCACVIL